MQCLAAAERRAAAAAAASMSEEADARFALIPPPPSPLPRFDPLATSLKGRAHAQLMKAWAETHGQPLQATLQASQIAIRYRVPDAVLRL